MSLSASSTFRPGLYALDGTGLGYQASEVAQVSTDVDTIRDLRNAIAQAMATARARGLSTFAPDDGILRLPSGISSALRDRLFEDVIGTSFTSANALASQRSLEFWSYASESLAEYAAKKASTLPPGEGGGPQYASGHWYVNGEPFTLSELFLAVRMGSFQQLENYVSQEIGTQSANANLARKVLTLLGAMKKAFSQGNTTNGTYNLGTQYKSLLDQAGITLDEMSLLGQKTTSSASQCASAAATYTANNNATMTGTDYGALVDEVRAVFDASNSNSQVQQLRVESAMNSRTNHLEGMTAFLKGQVAESKALAQNLR
jgi:hypothetical protein